MLEAILLAQLMNLCSGLLMQGHSGADSSSALRRSLHGVEGKRFT